MRQHERRAQATGGGSNDARAEAAGEGEAAHQLNDGHRGLVEARPTRLLHARRGVGSHRLKGSLYGVIMTRIDFLTHMEHLDLHKWLVVRMAVGSGTAGSTVAGANCRRASRRCFTSSSKAARSSMW